MRCALAAACTTINIHGLCLQTEREKANAVDMHTTFQQELVKLRLATAKAYMQVLTDGQVLANSSNHCHTIRSHVT